MVLLFKSTLIPRKLSRPSPFWSGVTPAACSAKLDHRRPLLGRFSRVVLVKLVVIAAELVSRPGISERTWTVSLGPSTARWGEREVIRPTSITTESARQVAKFAAVIST